jgi:hypothetical protein
MAVLSDEKVEVKNNEKTDDSAMVVERVRLPGRAISRWGP